MDKPSKQTKQDRQEAPSQQDRIQGMQKSLITLITQHRQMMQHQQLLLEQVHLMQDIHQYIQKQLSLQERGQARQYYHQALDRYHVILQEHHDMVREHQRLVQELLHTYSPTENNQN